MTTNDGVMEIQKTFDINTIYAKHVFSLADKNNLILSAGKIINEKPKPFVKWVGGKRQLLEINL